MKRKYFNKANAIIRKMKKIAVDKGIYENFGEKELRKFNALINQDDELDYAERAELSAYLSEMLLSINDKNKFS